ncbi:MAG: DUF5667 domain-containing protein [bacterium]
MNDKEAIKFVSELKKIKPREQWVVSAKYAVFGEQIELKRRLSVLDILPKFGFRLALAPITIFSLLFAVFAFSRNALPGDPLYSVKRMEENVKNALVSQAERPIAQLELTDKRLAELRQIANTNQAQKLAPALDELKANKDAVKKEFSQMIKNSTEKDTVKMAKEIAIKMKATQKEEGQIMASLGIESREQVDPAERAVAEILIKDAEGSTLTEKQTGLLNEAKADYEAGLYQNSLTKLIELSYPQ